MNENKYPSLRFKSFNENWNKYRLEDVTSYYSSSLTARNVIKNGKYPLYDANSIIGYTNHKIMDEEYLTIIKDGSGVGRIRLLSKGTSFIGTMGGILNKESFNIDYLHIFFQRFNFKPYITGANIPHVYYSDYSKADNYHPKISEQKKIGDFFKTIDSLIDIQQKKITKQEQLKKSYLNDMFPKTVEKVPRIRFKGFKDKWKLHKLGDIGSTFNSLSGKSAKDFGHGKAQYITYMNVYKNIIANKDGVEKIEIDNKQTEVKYGDILFTTSSETIEEVGMSSVWLADTTHTYLNSFCFGYRLNFNVYPYYMAYILRSHLIRKQMITLGQGISRYNISKVKSMEIDILIPSLEEQKKIGDFFYNLDKKIKVEKEKLKKLQSMKKAYLNEMFV